MLGIEDRDSPVRAGIVLLVLAVGVYLGAHTIADPDLWGHVRFGQDMLASGQVSSTDPYSYLTGDQEWINHEWLAEVLFAAVFDTFGPRGLLAVKTLMLLAILGLVYRHLLARGVRTVPAGAVVLLVAFMMQVGDRTIRPQLFTYLFFLLVVLAIYRADAGRPWALWLMPLVFAAWANFHGGFVAGLGLLGVWSAAAVATTLTAAKGPVPLLRPCCGAVLPLIASLLATLLNPYGLKQLTFLVESLSVPRPDIWEWLPLDIASTEGAAYLAMVSLAVATIATTTRRRSPALIVALACTAVLPLTAMRHLPLFALAGAVLAGEHFGAAWDRWLPPVKEPANPAVAPRLRLTGALLPLAGAMAFSGAALLQSTSIPIDPYHAAYPVRAIHLLKASGLRGNLAVYFDWGQYALWYLGPTMKVSYDGRRESIYSDRVRAMNNRWVSGLGHWDAVLDEHSTDLALIDKRLAGYNLMCLKPGWKLVYEDALCGLFARDEPRLVRAIQDTPVPDLPADGAGLCFP